MPHKEMDVPTEWGHDPVRFEYTDRELADWLVDDVQRRYREGEITEQTMETELERVLNYEFEEIDFIRWYQDEFE